MKIALLSDDSIGKNPVSSDLVSRYDSCHFFADFKSLSMSLEGGEFDLVVLELPAYSTSWLDTISTIRNRGLGLACLLCVVNPTNEEMLVEILNRGADDCVPSSVPPVILDARIGAMIRRMRWNHAAEIEASSVTSDIRFDATRRCANVRGVLVHLTDREFEIASLLFRHMGKLLSCAAIIEHIWWRDIDPPSPGALEAYMSVLRGKLRLRPLYGYSLSSVCGRGYCLERISSRHD